jgi:hypothetical protein
MESYEECLREAAECDRLAGLAGTQATRTIIRVIAFQWRKLAEKTAEREKSNRRGFEIDVFAVQSSDFVKN